MPATRDNREFREKCERKMAMTPRLYRALRELGREPGWPIDLVDEVKRAFRQQQREAKKGKPCQSKLSK